MSENVQVKTVENTNSASDIRSIDRSWKWRRLMFFLPVCGSLLLIGWLLFGRLAYLSDPVLVLYVKYSYYTMWLGLCLYGAQSSLSEVAEAMAIFFSGRRTILTSAPKEAVVEAVSGGVKVASGETTAPIAAATTGPASIAAARPEPPEDPPWQSRS